MKVLTTTVVIACRVGYAVYASGHDNHKLQAPAGPAARCLER